MPGFWQQLKVGGHLFSRPAIRSYYLWAEILFLLMVVSVAVFLTAFFRLPLSGQLIFDMSLPVVFLTMLWFGILRVHQVVHEAYRGKWDSQNNEPDDHPQVDMLLDKLAFLSYAGFMYAASAVALAYGAFVPIIAIAHR
jgi:hypothetical protein